MLMPIPNFI